MATANHYKLSYVNEAAETFDYDTDFPSLAEIEAFVAKEHPKATSYQIIVVLGAPSKVEA